ncbi:MAG: GAF domain-containing sensor histidine kinase [Anaerolineae bacterium]|nr:GAF domain-containing sensor histidine kinase [Anaerolineae bacterium]
MASITPVENQTGVTHADNRLREALANLNQIGTAINRFSPQGKIHHTQDPAGEVRNTLLLIVESAIRVVPGASAVIYIYDQGQHAFDLSSRVSAGEPAGAPHQDNPRPDGIGVRAINQRRRVISYEEPDLTIHPMKVQVGARAMACFPLVVTYQAVGALYVYLHEQRQFDPIELLMLENFVNQAAMAIYQARRLASVQRDLQRKEEELKRLRRAGLLISSRMGLQETLETILHMALDVTGAHYGIFRLVDENSAVLVTHAVAGEDHGRPQADVLPIDDHSIMGWVAGHRQPLRIHDLQAAPWVRIYRPLYKNLNMRSELAVPLVGSSGRLEGVLNLESPLIGAFSEEDSLSLQALATQAVIAIQEARLLDTLLEVTRLLLVQPCQQVLEHLVRLAAKLLNATSSAIWTLKDDHLCLQAAGQGQQHEKYLPLHTSLTGQAVLQGRAVTSEAVQSDQRFYRADLAQEQDWGEALIVPLLSSDRRKPIGAFSVYGATTEPEHFAKSEWDEKVLTCLAHYAALALHNAEWQEMLRTTQERHAVAETFAAIGDIAANVLHHLNNKVGTIPVRIQGIQDKCADELLTNNYLAANLEEIERSAREALHAVRENLTHLRPLHLAPVSIDQCIAAAIQAAGLFESNIRIVTVGVDSLPPVIAGQQSLTWVFTNLLENAAHAMQGTGMIMIQAETDAQWVQIAVCDDGPGIPPERRAAIFEFSAAERTTKRNGKLGFGLWWVKTLIMRLGGTITMESDGQHGTTFHLQLPRAEAS